MHCTRQLILHAMTSTSVHLHSAGMEAEISTFHFPQPRQINPPRRPQDASEAVGFVIIRLNLSNAVDGPLNEMVFFTVQLPAEVSEDKGAQPAVTAGAAAQAAGETAAGSSSASDTR